jgi:hypothetical protein
MKTIDAQEFCDDACRFLASDEVITIERDGEPVGYYLPTANGRRDPVPEAERSAAIDESLARFEKLMEEILDRTGMTEDEFARYFDLNEPLPEQSKEQRATLGEAEHAVGG